jgi:2-polyprenyl-3-methyl-5-hydroxy-6-metoxy-1,4-benzoquinol methylase
MNDVGYAEQLNREAEVWGAAAAARASAFVPDWTAHRTARENVVQHARDVDRLLACVVPGMRALELGCGSGWLTIALARRGASALGIDIAASAVELGRRHYDSIRGEICGVARYEVADLNTCEWPDAQFDLVVAKGVLHHLVALEDVIQRVHRALAPGGVFWVSDTHGDEGFGAATAAGALLLLLPTHVSFREKVRAIGRFGLTTPDRIRASMEARGLSPFEGAGRRADWVAGVKRLFELESESRHPAITGYVAAQLQAPDRLAHPLLRALAGLDRMFVAARVLRSTGVTIVARKPRLR